MIELGDVSAPEAATTAAPDWRPPELRRILLALFAVLCLLGVNASAPATPRGVRPLWHVPITDSDVTVLGPKTAYLHRIIDGQARLTAYDLATGKARWEVATGDTVSWLQLDPTGRILLMPTSSGSADGGSYISETLGVSAATGAELWRIPGEVNAVYGDSVLMNSYDPHGLLSGLRLVRLSDQTVLWSQNVTGIDSLTVADDGDQPTKIITVRRGAVRIYRYADGVLVKAAQIAWPDPTTTSVYTDISATADELVVNRASASVSRAEIYRLDTLAPLWNVYSATSLVFACAESVCSTDDSGMVAHDPATGREQWRVNGATMLWELGDRIVLADSTYDGNRWLIDATGKRIGGRVEGSWVQSSDPGGAILLLRTTVQTPTRTSVSRWDLRTGHVDLLGAIDGLGNHCDAVPGYLACIHGNSYDVDGVL